MSFSGGSTSRKRPPSSNSNGSDSSDDPINRPPIRVPKMVIKNVKDAHQCHDWGEAQEHRGDLDYLLEGIAPENSDTLKCLSMVRFMKKCLSGPFRQYIRAKGGITSVFQHVSNYLDYRPLAMCTAGVVYILSRDRLGLAVDELGLRVLVKLVRTTVPVEGDPEKKDFDKYKEQVWQILCEWLTQIRSSINPSSEFMFDITQENLTPSFLAVESLVFISARTKDQRFKEGMLRFGGIQFIVQALLDSVDDLPSEARVDPKTMGSLKLIQRYLRILEQVTMSCVRVQKFLTSHRDCVILNCCGRLLSFCRLTIPKHVKKEPASAGVSGEGEGEGEREGASDSGCELVSTLMALVRLCCNLSNENELCCSRMATTEDFLEGLIEVVTWLGPGYIPHQKLFDLIFLELGLLINMVESSNDNRRLLIGMNAKLWPIDQQKDQQELPTLQAFTHIFQYHSGKAAALDEEVGREMVEEAMVVQSKAANKRPGVAEKELEETVENALHKAGKHMEDTIMAAYLALLVGFLILDNEHEADVVRDMMPERKFTAMTDSLKTLQKFMELSNVLGSSGQEGIEKVLQLFQSLEIKD